MENSKSVSERVKEVIIERLGVDEKDVIPGASFTDLGADSLDKVELIMTLEQKFNLSMKDEDAEKLITVGDAIEYIEKQCK